MNPQALDTLRDIHLPPAPLLWQTTEMWIALAIAAVAIAWSAYRYVRRSKLRAALRTLSALTAAHDRDGDAVRLARGLSGLLRHYALTRFPEAGIAALTDAAWMAFLDAHGGKNTFRHGAGAVLATLPYQASGTADAAALVAAVRAWLRENPQ